jgi:hypothetical protein
MKRLYLILLPCLLFVLDAKAQLFTGAQEPIIFTERTAVLSNPQFRSVLITGVGDINADGLDDIIRLNNGRTLEYQIQLPNQQFETIDLGQIADKPQYSLGLADLDANGVNDLLVAGNGDGIKIFKNGSSTPTVLPQSIFFAQGSNVVDINGDGYLDIFVNNDTSINRIWLNDGQGNFARDLGIMPLQQNPVDSMNGGNYAAVWTDIDNDRDLDCFIAKCFRRPIPDDPRLVNQLYLNEGSSSYREVAAERGLDSDAQSWTADFQDIDNDGDMDCFLLNHYTTSELLINDGTGFFTNETLARGIRISRNYFQSLLRDFDNDGFVDLLVAGPTGYEVYQNQGDGTFASQRNIFSIYPMGTFAVGDLNRDGFLDVYSASANVAFTDKLWINEQNEKNHFLGISLEGQAPHINAIGARVYLYGPWGIQIREVRSGESYGIVNTLDLHFGLGEHLSVDSLRVDWPDGSTEKFFNIPGDQYIQIEQGDCIKPDDQIKVEGDFTICPGDTVRLSAPAGLDFQWSDGSIEPRLTVTEAGTYRVTVTGSQGCSRVSRAIQIEVEELEIPEIEQVGSNTFCEGEKVELIAPPGLTDFIWSDGSTEERLAVTSSGTYFLLINGLCNTVSSDSIVVKRIDAPPLPQVEHDTLSGPGNTLLIGDTENLYWYRKTGQRFGTGDRVIVPAPQTDTFYVSRFVNIDGLFCESAQIPVYVVVDPSINEKDPSELELRIFPNPTQETFQVHIPRNWLFADATMFSSDGRLLWQTKFVPGPNEVAVNSLSSGVYFLNLKSPKEEVIKRILIR